MYLVSSGEKDEQGNLIADNKLWRRGITRGSMLCSKDHTNRRISLGYVALNKYNKACLNPDPHQ